MRTIWVEALERARSEKGILNSVTIFTLVAFSDPGLGQEVQILGFVPASSRKQINCQCLAEIYGVGECQEYQLITSFALRTFFEFWIQIKREAKNLSRNFCKVEQSIEYFHEINICPSKRKDTKGHSWILIENLGGTE